MRHKGTEASRRRDKLGHKVKAEGKIRRLVVFCTLVVLCFAAGLSAEETGLFISVSTDAQVAGDRILLGQVAEITGGTEALRKKLSVLDLGASPRPGKERRVPGRLIESSLSSCGWLPAGSRTNIPDWLVVTGASQTLSAASLEAVFRTYVDRRTGEDEVAVSNIKIRGVKPMPLGKVALTPLGHGDDYVKGNITLRLAVTVAGEDQGKVSISGWVDRYVLAVCAARSVQRGSVISHGDVLLKRVNVSKGPGGIVYDPDQVTGMQARTRIRAGECIRERMLETPPLIEKGDRVKLLVQSGGLRVSTMGIAKADGLRGEQIRVENVTSEQTVVGRVVNGNTVEVLF